MSKVSYIISKLFLTNVLLLLLFPANFLQAQNYVPFPDSVSIWSEVFTNQQPEIVETYQYGLWGDTMINSNLYNKVYKLNDTIYPLNVGQYCGAIREDSLKRVFVIGCECADPGAGNDEEVILYDFSKLVGDTVFVGMDGIGPFGYLVIDHIDSILIDDNYRKTFHFAASSTMDYWIEGIGSIRGLFSPIQWQPTGYQKWKLICFNQENDVKYLNPEFNNCFPLLTRINSLTQNVNIVLISPNPVTDISILSFTNTHGDYYKVEIFNMLGNKVKQINLHGESSMPICKFDYKPGIYIYKISGNNSVPIKGKIIIK